MTSVYKVSQSYWKKTLARRVAALGIDLMVATFLSGLGLLFADQVGMRVFDGAFWLMLACSLFFLRVFELSLGNLALGFSVHGSTIGKNFLRATALFVPGYNLFDWAYAIYSPRHETYTDTKLRIRLVDEMLIG